MAKLDFPSSPTFNQRYPDPAVPGIPVYTWDLEKWVASGPVGSPPQAPFDAMAYSGMQINGGMEVSQELGVAGTAVSGAYVCDGWQMVYVGSMALAGFAAKTGNFVGLPYLLYVTTNTAQGSLGANDYTYIWQKIEGWRIARLSWGTANAQPITLGFWTAHHRAGVYGGTVRNSASNRTYAFTYTQAVADTAQYNTITIPGDTAGTWNTDNTIGITITFSLGCGTTYTAPSAGTWLASNYVAAPGQINAVAATSDVFRITGVTVFPGTQAPAAAQSPNIMRPYDQELPLCERYYTKDTTIIQVPAAGAMISLYNFGVTMRATPTVAFSGVVYANASGLALNYGGAKTLGLQLTGTAAGGYATFTMTADARL